jgi:hypothetical protein
MSDVFYWVSLGALTSLMWVQNWHMRRWSTYHLRNANELVDAWTVLIECAKVLEQHEDFNSKPAARLIQELYNKYPPRRAP